MQFVDFISMIARRWRWVTLGVLLGLAGAGVVLISQTSSYSATAQLFVGARASNDVSTQLSSTYVLSRMDTYAAMYGSAGIPEEIKRQLGLTQSADRIKGQLSVSVVPKTVLLQVKATDRRAGTAATIATSAATLLASTVERFEVPAGASTSAVQVRVVTPAQAPSAPSSPNSALILGFGLVLGAGAGLLAASVREQVATGRRPSSDVRSDVDEQPAVPTTSVT